MCSETTDDANPEQYKPKAKAQKISINIAGIINQSPIVMEMQRMLQRMPLIPASRKRRNWLMAIVAVAGTGYGVYRLYQSPSIARKKSQIARFLTSLMTISEAASASADTIALVSNDLKKFLQSDSDEVPTSLKQLFKIAQCHEFQRALTRVSGALTAGVIQGVNGSNPPENGETVNSAAPGVPERMLDRLFTANGTGFVSVVVGSFARNLVLAFFENSRQNNNGVHNEFEILQTVDVPSNASSNSESNSRPPMGSAFVDVLCSDKCRALIAECIQRFVSTAVSVYLDKTMDINVYNDICSGLTNPKHEAQMKGILMSVFNGAVETLIRTSHEVLTSGGSSVKATTIQNSCLKAGKIELNEVTEETELVSSSSSRPSLVRGKEICGSCAGEIEAGAENREQTLAPGAQIVNSTVSTTYRNWADRISYTLAIPSNRKLFIEVSGRITFEAVRSFFEFMLFKLSEFFTRTLPVISYNALDNMLHFLRYVGAKSIVVATVCLAICLHILTGVRVLETA
eukprot:Gb_38583 [translate_table: standard]